MFETLSLEKFIELSSHCKRIPVYKKISADIINPIFTFEALKDPSKEAFLLESNEQSGEIGRFTFLGFDPHATFESKGKEIKLTRDGTVEKMSGDPLEVLRTVLDEFKMAPLEDLPPLIGGAVGYMTYDAIRLFEKIPDRHKDVDKYPDIYFSFYNTMIAFDHLKKTAFLTHIVQVKDSPRIAYREALDFLKHYLEKILSFKPIKSYPASLHENTLKPSSSEMQTDISDAGYEKIVLKAKEYIKKGDIFQVVPSRKFVYPLNTKPFDIYRALRMINPSPYMFYLYKQDSVILGASPERLVSVNNRIIETMPIAGTRPRGVGEEDIRLEKELLSDPKEIAEHTMLVDLARNDLGMVATPASVRVKDLKMIQRFSHVMHIVSTVTAQLKEGYDALDALRATLPAGTLSGAPKIRAMEIIDELETSKRGLYGGAICYLDSRGNLDSCIAIRMACIKDGLITVRAGGGVVYDSDPKAEAMETRHKSEGVLKAIKIAEEGLK